jgi:hypothetical protein
MVTGLVISGGGFGIIGNIIVVLAALGGWLGQIRNSGRSWGFRKSGYRCFSGGGIVVVSSRKI